MAGFEVVVRPVVFPGIRPAPAQPVPPADDPEQGFATIHGNGGKHVDLSSSYSSSASSSTHTEIERRVDEARVYQKKEDGKVNKKNFIDIEVANRIKMKGPPSQNSQNRPSFAPGQGPMSGDDFINDWTPERIVEYYRRIREKDNIEIRKKDLIKKKGQEE